MKNERTNHPIMIAHTETVSNKNRYSSYLPWYIWVLGAAVFLVAAQLQAGSAPQAGSTQQELKMIAHEATQGDSDAQLLYGLTYLEGRYQLQPDPRKAAYWLLRAARDGQHYAALEMGKLLAQGKGVKRNPEHAVYWWRKAAEDGIPEAQYRLGKAYFDGFGIKENPDKSIYWMTMAAKNGNHEAEYELGRMYHQGYATEKNNILARDWLSRAARSGNFSAINFLAGINQAVKYTTLVYQQSAEILEEKARNGDSTAQYELGLRYESGAWAVIKNDKKALHWLTQAANNGNLQAMISLADIYSRGGLGVEKNPGQVVYWTKMAKKHQ